MKNNKLITSIIDISIVTAIYVVLTVGLAPISFSSMQLRLSEILLVLVLFNKKYSIALILGCLISNFFSPYLLWDVIFGTLGTVLSVICMMGVKKGFSLLIFPPIFNGVAVGLEIAILEKMNFWLMFFHTFCGELIVMVLAFGVYLLLKNNKQINEFLKTR